ncbi:MAG: sensor histidine kinase [Spirochaetaceae bacterium]
MKHERPTDTPLRARAEALRITAIYLVLGTLWILFSDSLILNIASGPTAIARLQSIKGVVFVVLTAAVIYVLLHHSFRRLYDTNRALEDSTEQHRTSEDYLRALFQAAPLAFYDLDVHARVKHLWNPAAEALFGWTRDEVLGRPLPFIPGDRGEEFLGLFEEVLRGRSIVAKELPRVRRDGSEIYIELSAVPLYDKHGEVTGVLAIASDTTEKRRSALELKSALDEKDALLREVHHRVKNNLAVMTGLIRLQLHEASAEDRSASALSKTRDRMEVMSLIHNMLYHEQNLSRIEFGGILTRMVNQLFDRYAASRAVRLELDLEEVELEVGTALPLGLIANEAVTNALTHAFHAEGAHNRLVVRLRAPGSAHCMLCIEDNGSGIGADFDVDRQNSLGFRMMLVLAQQVQARLAVVPGADDHGARVEVWLPG